MTFPIKGFIETSFIDWPGKISSIIFLPHCNFRCPYCHNHELVLNPEQFPSFPMEHIIKQLRHFGNWIDGVCITGGEPTLFTGLTGLIKRLRKEGVLIKLDTNGSNPQVIEQLIRDKLVDFIAMDVKAPLEKDIYSRCCGVSVNLDNIKASVTLLRKNHVPYQFRTTVVPTFLTQNNLVQMARELQGSKGLKLQNFNPVHTLDVACEKIVPYSEDTIKDMQKTVDKIIAKNEQNRREDFLSTSFG